MTPFGSDFRQRQQNEGALIHPRMRQERRALAGNTAPVSQKVEIDQARRIDDAAHPPEFRLDAVQKRQQRLGREVGFDRGDGIDEPRLVGDGHRLAMPKL